MFAQYTYIDETHKMAMTSVIRQQTFVTEAFLAKLYKAALEAMKSPGKPPDHHTVVSCVKSKEATVGTATDMQSGVYVQLADSGKGNMLTVGKKWAIQGHDSVSNSIAIKLL